MIAERAGRGTLSVVDGAGHLIALEQPDRLAAIVGDFLLGRRGGVHTTGTTDTR